MKRNSVSFSNKEIMLLTLVTLSGILISVIFSYSLALGFSPGLTFLILLARRKGVLMREQSRMALKGINQVKEVIWIFILIGMTLPAWMLSDTIPQMVQLALSNMNVHHFFVLCFIMSALLSMVLGTSVGTLSTIGIPLISAAQFAGLPLDITAGALVSGSFVGDRTSPLSSSHQLLSHTLEVPVQSQFKSMLPTLIFGTGFSLFFFHFFDGKTAVADSNTISSGIAAVESIQLIVFLPPALLLLLVIFRVKIRYAFLASIAAAFLIAIFKGVAVNEWVHAVWFGVEELESGVQHMLVLMIFIAMAGTFNGIIEELKIIQPLMDQWIGATRTLQANTFKTILTTLGISMIACNQTLPIILTGRSLLSHWKKWLNDRELVRVMGDSTMMFPGMIPWSLLAILCSTVLGVPVLSYLPYAVLLWTLPITTIIFSFIKGAVSSTKLSKDEKLA
jgi:NhaC family Na+:H+ antiporter